MMQNPGYIFGGDTGETAESLARKRAIAQRMVAGSGSAPRNVGEGIARIGEALAGAYIGRKANDAQKKGEAEAAEAFASIFGGMGGGGLGAAAAGESVVAPMPASTSPGVIETQPLAPPASPSGYSADAARGALSDYDAQLAEAESGGNYGAVNAEGYSGRYQFGEARLQDYKAATGRDFTMEEFLANPQLQEEVQAWHNADIDGFAQEQGVPFGSEVGGVPLTPTSFRGMAHLGGKQGALKFVQSGGEYNPADSNGTRLSDYGSRFAGAAAAQPVNAAPAPSPQPSGPDQARIAQIAQVMQHPFINPAQRAIAEQLLQAELAKAQPAMTPYQQAQLELAQRRLEAQLSGQLQSGVNVNVGGPPKLGPIPAGNQVIYNPVTQEYTMTPVAGSPAARDAAAAEEKKDKQTEQTARAAGVVIEDLGRIREKVESSILPVTGLVGAGLSKIPGTNAYDVSQLVETVGANIGFDRLQAMRDASPTGGALGSITERELAALRAVLGSLEQGQTEEQFIENLGRLEEIYAGIMSKAAGYPNAAEFGFTDAASSQPESDPELDAILEKYK